MSGKEKHMKELMEKHLPSSTGVDYGEKLSSEIIKLRTELAALKAENLSLEHFKDVENRREAIQGEQV